jgi:hypothetical protein
MREIRSYGSVGAPGGEPPGSTRNDLAKTQVYSVNCVESGISSILWQLYN